MLQDSSIIEASYQRFIKRITESEIVFYLSNDDGVANSVSNDDEEKVILMFWSDKAYASSVNHSFDNEYFVKEIELFNFLYRWLPGMSSDGVLAGVNWDGNLFGNESDPFELREEIQNKMSKSILKKYESKYNSLSKIT